jgi:hypothetical protein
MRLRSDLRTTITFLNADRTIRQRDKHSVNKKEKDYETLFFNTVRPGIEHDGRFSAQRESYPVG